MVEIIIGGKTLGREEDLGRETPFNGERGLSPKPTLYQSRSHHAPSIINADFSLCHGRSAVGKFLRWMGLGRGELLTRSLPLSKVVSSRSVGYAATSPKGRGFFCFIFNSIIPRNVVKSLLTVTFLMKASVRQPQNKAIPTPKKEITTALRP